MQLAAAETAADREQRAASLEVHMESPFGLPMECWSIEVELDLPAGNAGRGRRVPDAMGAVIFDSLPIGEGMLSLRWNPAGADAEPWRDGVVVHRQPITIEMDSHAAVSWNALESSLALVELTVEDPSGTVQAEDLALLTTAPTPEPDSAPALPDGDVEIVSLERVLRTPIAPNSRVHLIQELDGGAFSIALVESWKVRGLGAQPHVVTIPNGRIAVQLTGDPPHGEGDWSNYEMHLARDPRWRPQMLPMKAEIDAQGRVRFQHVASGDYLLQLAWEESGDSWFMGAQFERWIHFPGGELSLSFATSGAGAVALSLPTELPPGAREPGVAPPRVWLRRHEESRAPRDLAYPEDPSQPLRFQHLAVGRWSFGVRCLGMEATATIEIEPESDNLVTFGAWHSMIPVHLELLGTDRRDAEQVWILTADGRYFEDMNFDNPGHWIGNLPPGKTRVVVADGPFLLREAHFEVPESLPENAKRWETTLTPAFLEE